MIPSLAIDVSLASHDLIVSSSSRGFGIAEIALTVPQLVGGFWALHEGKKPCEDGGGTVADHTSVDDREVPLVMLIATALLAHGIYVVATPRGSTPAKVTLVPSLAGDRNDGLGLALAGRF